jgi:hypothetical protein
MKDMEMLRRYKIIDKNMLKRGVTKLKAYLDKRKMQPPKVVAISG